MSFFQLVLLLVQLHVHKTQGDDGSSLSQALGGEPQFLSSIINASVPVGRDAALECYITKSQGYKVAWVRVETQTILTMNEHVITRNHRIKVSHPEPTEWRLDISQVKRRDAGWYMCQVNTDPMKSQLGYLEVVEPPAILDSATSQDQVVREGEDVVLACKAGGHPAPRIKWRREDGGAIRQEEGSIDGTVSGPIVSLQNVARSDMGAYLCIAQNGVPPTVSRRITLDVIYPPTVIVDREVIGVGLGATLMISCSVEAHPSPVTVWTTQDNRAIIQGGRFKIVREEKKGAVDTNLIIQNIAYNDNFARFKCTGRNSLGISEKTITVHITDEIPSVIGSEETNIEAEIVYKAPGGAEGAHD